MKCKLTGYDGKKVIFAIISAWVLIFILDFLTHGLILKGAYEKTAPLWRTPDDMNVMMKWMFLVQLFFACAFVVIFGMIYRYFKENCLLKAMGIGLLISLVPISTFTVQYLTTPLPGGIYLTWVVATLIQGTALGALTFLFLKNGEN